VTYSLLARDPATGDLGVAVQSHFFGVGRLVPWAAPGIGVVVTQSFVEASYGPRGLALLAAGIAPPEALGRLLDADGGIDRRQVALMTADGTTAVHTGEGCIPAAGHAVGDGISVHANLVESEAVWGAMIPAFETSEGDLARRMLAALEAAERAGGDIRGRQAAAMIVVRGTATGAYADDRPVDVRVDDHPDPLGELARLLDAGEAMAGLLRLLEEPGMLTGPLTVPDARVAEALAELESAQAVLGAGNLEPTLWRGLLLARAGRDDEARVAFALAAATDPRVPVLVRRLAAVGMWTRGDAALDAVLAPTGTPNCARPGADPEEA